MDKRDIFGKGNAVRTAHRVTVDENGRMRFYPGAEVTISREAMLNAMAEIERQGKEDEVKDA